MRKAAFFVLAFVGCAATVQHTPAGPDTYLITVDGTHHSHGELMQLANKRALKVCGPGGYDVVGTGSGSTVSGHANSQMATVSSKGSVSMHVRCR